MRALHAKNDVAFRALTQSRTELEAAQQKLKEIQARAEAAKAGAKEARALLREPQREVGRGGGEGASA